MQNYKDLIVWQKSHALTLEIYRIVNCFPKEELFILTSQLKRACLSIPLNIAEGCGRFTDADTAHFFQNSLGSAQETEYCLLVAKDLQFIPLAQYETLNRLVNEIKAMLISLIQKIRGRK